jgi:hypothetical protein
MYISVNSPECGLYDFLSSKSNKLKTVVRLYVHWYTDIYMYKNKKQRKKETNKHTKLAQEVGYYYSLATLMQLWRTKLHGSF